MTLEEQQYVDEHEEHVDDYVQPEEETTPFEEALNDESVLDIKLELQGDGREVTYDTISVGGNNFDPPHGWRGNFQADVMMAGAQEPPPHRFTSRDVKLVKFKRSGEVDITKFHLGMGLLAHFTGMPLSDFLTWLELLSQLRDKDGNPIPDITSLPRQLATLKGRGTSQPPLQDMRVTQIPSTWSNSPPRLHSARGSSPRR